MADFVWGTDWRQYLQNQAYVDDIRDAQASAARETVAAIDAGSRSILLGLETGMGEVADAQRESGRLIASAQWDAARMAADATKRAADRVVGAIGDLDSTFRWGFGQVIGTLGGMSTSLSALVQSAKTPAQTAAYEQFEIARDAFRKSLYAECLEALDKAVSGDHTSPGYKLEWRFHQLAGVVRLGFAGCDVKLVDPPAAEQSFLLAARYARADAPADAARALFSAGWAAFVQGKLHDALTHTEAAIGIDARFAEALFQAARVRMTQGDPDGALPALRRAIDVDRGYAMRASGDDVFLQHSPSLHGFLEALRDEKSKTLQPVASARLAVLAPLVAKSAALGTHRTIRRLATVAEPGSVVGLMDLLEVDQNWEEEALELSAFINELTGQRILREVHVSEARDVQETYEVDEPYDVQEAYSENVIIPGGLFRKERVEVVQRNRTVRKVRKVSKTRTVRRVIDERQQVWVNGFGDVHQAPLDGWILLRPGMFVRMRVFHFYSPFIPERHSDMGREAVTITRAFFMKATPVTQAQYLKTMGHNTSRDPERADCPVVQVTWFDAIAYCNALSRAEGLEEAYVIDKSSVQHKKVVGFDVKFWEAQSISEASVRWKGLDSPGYRLPTDAEWEYACRAGTTDRLHGKQDAFAWSEDNSGGTLHPVGQKLSNPWGLFDMCGGVMEWCWDWYYDRAAAMPTETENPTGPTHGEKRVCRGMTYSSNMKSDLTRLGYKPDHEGHSFGFRIVRSSPSGSSTG